MSTSDTDSDPEPAHAADAVSSLAAFANLSATRQPDLTGQSTVGWAVDTLATLDFQLVRKDNALHGLIQNCASTILALFDAVLQRGQAIDESSDFILDIVDILRPSFLQLLFQYRRLFRVIAGRDFKPDTAPLATVCWVDVILAKLGSVVALVAAGLDGDHFDQSLPEPLKSQREEDILRAAIQLPDSWDMLPSMLISERVSAAAKRLSTRLMLGRYILRPVLSGLPDDTIHQLLSTFAEFVRQGAARVDELHSVAGPSLRCFLEQERLVSAMAISLFAAADLAQGSSVDQERAAAFRPQTMAAAMKHLRFVLDKGAYNIKMNILNPPDHLDAPTGVIIRWGIVPQWTWSVWLEYSNLHADAVVYLTTTYIRHYSTAAAGALLDVSDLVSMNSRSSDQAAVIGVMIDLIFRFISVLSTDAHAKQVSSGMVSILHESCRLISQWINRNSCGIRRSKECCKALIILFGHLSQKEQYFALNELVIECLGLMSEQCIREAWKVAIEDNSYCFAEARDQNFTVTKMKLSDELTKSMETRAAQLMKFLVVMMFKGVQPLDPGALVDFIEAVGDRVLRMPQNDRQSLCEILLLLLATANLSEVDLQFSKSNVVVDDEALWRLAMNGGGSNLFLTSAFSRYITSAPVTVEPLTFLEGLEHLLDMALATCTLHCTPEEEPLALLVLPTICDALAHLLAHRDDTTVAYTCASPRLSVLCSVLRTIGGGEDECDRHGALLRRRLSSTVLGKMDGVQEMGREKYELVFCRLDGSCPGRMLYIRG